MTDLKSPIAADPPRTDDLAEAVRRTDELLAVAADRLFRLADDAAAAGAPDTAEMTRSLAKVFSTCSRPMTDRADE